ncbi:hypothetical protein [Natrinema halophilum]|uniref:Uncharacterized protein n=1 Tax=Natrinema halophilum TaxID=1699371 RepID=A0A7D5H0T8_9EURY|nr:hypothetical protein [Natrinema halophilum]QLG47791.1 hypothetical protein HYG82_02495 [Natrinema halophilum]
MAGIVGLSGLYGTTSASASASASANANASASTEGPATASSDVSFNDNLLVDVGGLEGSSLTGGQRLDSLIGDNLRVDNGQLTATGGQISETLENRLEDAVTHLEVVGGTGNTWRVGPSEPTGVYHFQGAFGMLFETDRPVYFGECTIDAEEAGQFTPAVYRYDSATDRLVEQVDTVTIQARGGPQTIFLDFLVEKPGEYLLTRLQPGQSPGKESIPDDLFKRSDDSIRLMRSAGYDGGYSDDSRHGVQLKGGYNPNRSNLTPEPTTEYYYYYFDMEVSSAGG